MTEQVYKYNSLLTYPSNAPKILMIEIVDFFIFFAAAKKTKQKKAAFAAT